MADEAPRWRRSAPWFAAALFYSAFTLVQTWPLARHLSDVIPHDLGDPLLNAWILWWNAHAMPFTAKWWNAPAFWPTSGALAFSEVLLGLSPLTTPIQWLGGSAITAYNVAFLLTFPLSALAAHALVRRLSGRHDAAFVAGLVYGFNPFRVAHFPQLQVMTSWWMPLALLGLHNYLDSRQRRWLVLFAAAWLVQALSNGYYLLFFPILVGLWVAWFTLSRSNVRMVTSVAIAFAIGSLPLVPLLWTYRRIHSALNFRRDLGAVSAFGADITSLLDASPLLRFWQLTRFHQPEGELFPGFAAVALVVCVIVHWALTARRSLRMPRYGVALLAGALFFITIALSSLVIGPWSIRVAGVTLLSVSTPSKPLSPGVLLLLVAFVLYLRTSDSWQRRSTLMFYSLAMGLLYLLCFGPEPHFLGMPVLYRGPYRFLMALPGFDAVRVPARFAMIAVLCLSVVAGLAFARLTARAGHLARPALAVLVVCGVLADSAIGEMPLPALPARLASFESLPPGTAVMTLPLGDLNADVAAMYRGMYQARPVVNGYSGFFPSAYEVLHRGLEMREAGMFDAVAAWGPIVVMIDTSRDVDATWAQQLAHRPGTRFLGDEQGWKAFLLDAGVVPADVKSTEPLPIEAVSATVNGDHVRLAIDGDGNTRWASGPQDGSEVLIIDLGGERYVDGVKLSVGAHITEFPRTLVIESSDDKREWTTRWEGSGAVAALAGAIRHPAEMPLTVALPHSPARWIRLRQIGRARSASPWSITEMSVFGR